MRNLNVHIPEWRSLGTRLRGVQTDAGKLFACEREPKNAVGMYCGSLSDTERKVVTCLP